MFENLHFWPDSASEAASRTDSLYLFLVAVSVFFTVGITLALIVLAIRFRRRPGDVPGETHGSTLLEIAWIGIPLCIVLASYVWGAQLFFDAHHPPADAMEFYVTGKQWMWKVQHPTGHREINAMHVPLGRPIRITMTTEDVIHSFYVPAFRVKQDVVPGMYTRLWFEPNRTGRFHLFCAEYCGTNHSKMIGEVTVMEPWEYEKWLGGQAAGLPPAEAGKVLFESLRCVTCHAAGAGQKGPDLAGSFGSQVELSDGRSVLFDEDYVRESILDPRKRIVKGFEPLMPIYKGQVSEGQVLQLVAYIKSLAGEKTEGGK